MLRIRLGLEIVTGRVMVGESVERASGRTIRLLITSTSSWPASLSPHVKSAPPLVTAAQLKPCLSILPWKYPLGVHAMALTEVSSLRRVGVGVRSGGPSCGIQERPQWNTSPWRVRANVAASAHTSFQTCSKGDGMEGGRWGGGEGVEGSRSEGKGREKGG